MVHYIRFLRTPQVSEVPKKTFNVSAVITITTDLGDSYLSSNVDLIVQLVDATRSGEVLCSQTVGWQDGSRAIKLNVPCNLKFTARLVRVHATTQQTIDSLGVPAILDVWSKEFHVKDGARTDAVVERQFLLPNKSRLRMWEETGDSIAKHIWDASLGFLILFKQLLSDTGPSNLSSLQNRLTCRLSRRVRVLEVGAGCGIVGVALAQLRKSTMILTDLDDAQEILQINVDSATPLAGSNIHRQVLEWGPTIDTLAEPKFDLVLVSDCIYNPDSSLLLVETLIQVTTQNPSVLILVGFKRRHDADDIFFKRMQESGFIVDAECQVPLPHIMTDYDVTEPKVEMFVYRSDRP